MMKSGVELIADERQRQIGVKKWSSELDDTHTNDELLDAAVQYIGGDLVSCWPESWAEKGWFYKPSTRIRDLQKAGALIAAEIDRLNRLNNDSR